MYEKEFELQKYWLKKYIEQTCQDVSSRKTIRKLNTLINNFLIDVVGQYEVEKPGSGKKFYCLLPVFSEIVKDVNSNSYMRYTIDYNYGFMTLPCNAENNPKEYARQIIHEVFHYTPIYLEEEKNELFLEMVTVSILGKWRSILSDKVKTGEIAKAVAYNTYTQGLTKVKNYLKERMAYYSGNEYIKPVFLTIVITRCIYRMFDNEFVDLLKILQQVNEQVCYSDSEKKSMKRDWKFTADRHCISIYNFLSEIYSDIYMAEMCDLTPKEYIQMMEKGPGFSEEGLEIAGDTSIPRFGFMVKNLFSCSDWKEKTFQVLNELLSEGGNEKQLKNLKEYVKAYEEMVGKDDDSYFNNAMKEIVNKWRCNAKELKEKCSQSLDNLLNFEDAEYNVVDRIETLNNEMKTSAPEYMDIRILRARDKKRVPCNPYMPHIIYAETLPYRMYHRMFGNSFSEHLTDCDADYGRCNFTGNVW